MTEIDQEEKIYTVDKVLTAAAEKEKQRKTPAAPVVLNTSKTSRLAEVREAINQFHGGTLSPREEKVPFDLASIPEWARSEVTHLEVRVPLHEPDIQDLEKLRSIAPEVTDADTESLRRALEESQFYRVDDTNSTYELKAREIYPEGVKKADARKRTGIFIHGAKPGWRRGSGDQQTSIQRLKEDGGKTSFMDIQNNEYRPTDDVTEDPDYIRCLSKLVNATKGVGVLLEQRSAPTEKEMERRRILRTAELLRLRAEYETKASNAQELHRKEEEIRENYPLDYRNCSLGARKDDILGTLLTSDAETMDVFVHSMGAFPFAEAVDEMRTIIEHSSDNQLVLQCRAALEKLNKGTLVAFVPADYPRASIDMPPTTCDEEDYTGGNNYRGKLWGKFPIGELLQDSRFNAQIKDTTTYGKVILVQAGEDEVIREPIRTPQCEALHDRHGDEQPDIEDHERYSVERYTNGDMFIRIKGHRHAGMIKDEDVLGLVAGALAA